MGSPSGGKTAAVERPAAPEHFAAALCRHARAKTMAALADELARLVGAFHDTISVRTFLPRVSVASHTPTAGRALENHYCSMNWRRL